MRGDEAVSAIESIRAILWQEADGHWNPNKEWDEETLEYVAGVLVDLGLQPTESA